MRCEEGSWLNVSYKKKDGEVKFFPVVKCGYYSVWKRIHIEKAEIVRVNIPVVSYEEKKNLVRLELWKDDERIDKLDLKLKCKQKPVNISINGEEVKFKYEEPYVEIFYPLEKDKIQIVIKFS